MKTVYNFENLHHIIDSINKCLTPLHKELETISKVIKPTLDNVKQQIKPTTDIINDLCEGLKHYRAVTITDLYNNK